MNDKKEKHVQLFDGFQMSIAESKFAKPFCHYMNV